MSEPTPSPTAGRRRRRTGALLVIITAAAVSVTACAGSDGRLLLARDTSSGAGTSLGGPASGGQGTDIWAVPPGEQPSDASRVATDVVGPLTINAVGDDGTIARDVLGTTWGGSTLLSFLNVGGRSLTTAGRPGSTPSRIASTAGQLQTSLLRRGAFVATEDRCLLARTASDTERVGDGLCQVSEDERWVVSWPAQGGRLSIRDLRTGKVTHVAGTTTDAVALGRGASVLAIQATDAGKRGVVIDATTGEVTGRTATYRQMRAIPVTADSTGFTALAAADSDTDGAAASTAPVQVQLLWIATSAKVQVIDRGALLMPVHTDSSVTYVRLGDAQPGSDSIRRWDSSNGSRTVLLTGRVGAAAAGADAVVATRDTDRGVELYRTTSRGTLERVTTLDADTGQGSSVGRILTLDHTCYMEIAVGGTMALARIDLVGDASDVPIRGWAQVGLAGVDSDGTALVAGYRTTGDEHQTIGVVTPASDRYVERTTANETGMTLVHDGVIYLTERSDGGSLQVRSVRTQGRPESTTLYTGLQLGGATWPTDNGATVSTLMSRIMVLRQQQSAGGAQGGSGAAQGGGGAQGGGSAQGGGGAQDGTGAQDGSGSG